MTNFVRPDTTHSIFFRLFYTISRFFYLNDDTLSFKFVFVRLRLWFLGYLFLDLFTGFFIPKFFFILESFSVKNHKILGENKFLLIRL